MKKLLLTLVTALFLSAGAYAQKTELSVSYGGYTHMDASDCHDGWNGVKNAWGAVNAGVNFKIAPKIWVGPSYTFSSTTTGGGSDHSGIAYHGVLLNGRYEYYKNNIVTLYGHLGVGVVVSHMMPKGSDSYNTTYFGLQASPVGAQVGLNDRFTLYGELGYGVQGLLQVGFRVNL